jgi:type I restriction enzyme S subunit
MAKLGDFLHRSKIQIDIQDKCKYKRVKIRTKHQGVSIRDIEIGANIGTKKQFILKGGQFVLSKIDAMYGAFGIAPDEVEDAIITGNFWAYDYDKSKVEIEWLNHFTNSPDFYELCRRASTGNTHRKYLDEDFLLSYEVNLPSLSEQKKIVVKIDNIRLKVDSLNKELSHQLSQIENLNQAILQEAVQGKLVPQNKKDEPASELLKRIKAEKAKSGKKEKPLPQIKPEEIPFDIPESWVWCTIPELANNEKNALKAGPFGSSLKKQYYVKSGYKIYGQEQVIKQDPNYGDYYINEERFQSLKSCKVKSGDILISLVGTMGKVLILPKKIEPGIINPRLVKISLFESIEREYIRWFLYSPAAIKQIKHHSHGSTMDIINLGIISKLLIPLPPLPEQKRIVAEIEKQLAKTTQLKEHILANRQATEQLLKALLHQAFEVEQKEPLSMAAEPEAVYGTAKGNAKIIT